MALLEELTRLSEERDGGALQETELRQKLQQLVIGDQPADTRAMETELKKLRYEIALMQLDREYEAIRQECLIRCRRGSEPPTLGGFWAVVLVGTVWTLVLLNLVAEVKSKAPGPFWILLLAGVAWMAFWFGREAVRWYHKWTRLSDASYDWQRAREILEQSSAALVDARTPASPAAVT